MVKKKIDYILQIVQLYSYLLPTVKIGNAIMDFRKLRTLNGDMKTSNDCIKLENLLNYFKVELRIELEENGI